MNKSSYSSFLQTMVRAGLVMLVIGSPLSISLAEIGMGIAAFFWLLRIIFDKNFKQPGTFLDLPLILFAAWSIICSLLSPAPAHSLLGNKYLLSIFVMYIAFSALNDRFLKTLLFTWMGALIFSSVYGVVQSLTGIGLFHTERPAPYGEYFSRMIYMGQGFLDNHLTYGGYVAMASLFALNESLSRNVKQRWAYIISGITAAAAAVFSFCRSAWMGLIGGVFANGVLRGKKALLLSIAGLVACCALTLAVPPLRSRALMMFAGENIDKTRLQIYSATLGVLRGHYLTGIGAENYARVSWYYFGKAHSNDTNYLRVIQRPEIRTNGELAFRYYRVMNSGNIGQNKVTSGWYWPTGIYTHPHNDFLLMLLNGGIPLLALYLVIWALVLYNGIRFYFKYKSGIDYNRGEANHILGIVSVVILFLIMSITQCYIIDEEDAVLLWLLMGVFMYHYYKLEMPVGFGKSLTTGFIIRRNVDTAH